MGVRDFLTRPAATAAEPVTAAAEPVPVVADAEPVLPSGEGVSVHSRRASLSSHSWQERARRYYHDADNALDLCVEFVDLRSQLAGLYTARAQARSGTGWVDVEDELVQQVADEWRDHRTGEQSILIRDGVKELSLVGEAAHQSMPIIDGQTARYRARILPSEAVIYRSTAVVDGEEHVLIKLRSDAGPPPRNGVEVPGQWTWAPTAHLSRMQGDPGRLPLDASSAIQKGLRYLDRMDEIERRNMERTKTNRALSRLLLLSTNPDVKKNEQDPLVASYWAATQITQNSSDDLMRRYPVPMRVNDPDKAQILDLIEKLQAEDIEDYRQARELFASAMPMPKQQLLEGSGAGQRNLNNWMLDKGLHQQAIWPVLGNVLANATQCFFRPMIRQLQTVGVLVGYDAEDLRMGWTPIATSLADADPAMIIRAWQVGLLSEDEANEFLGVSGWSTEERPGVSPYEHWYMASRNASAMTRGPGPRDLLEGWGPDADEAIPEDSEPLALPAATASILTGW